MGNANVNSRAPKPDDHHRSIDVVQRAGGAEASSSQRPNAILHPASETLGTRIGQNMGYGESMLQSPPESPGSFTRSPLMFTPQIPMVPIARGDEFTLGPYYHSSGMYDQRGDYGGGVQPEAGVPTMIMWTHGGNSVAVEGSWDNWATRQPMQKVGKDFTIVKMLPSGVYQYRIILDQDWPYPPEVRDSVHNMLDVQDYVPENLDSVAGFEPPGSPISSYNDTFPSPEDFSKEPPALPSHLHLTLLNVPSTEDNSGLLPRPQHVTLNHLYVEKGRNLRSVLALGSSHRYRSKYVTVALYKPIK